MYEHYARIYGEDPTTEEAAPSEVSSVSPPSKPKWKRFCGFIPIPFLYSAGTKPIAPSSPSAQYGTLVSVSQVANNQGYTRLPGEAGPSQPPKTNTQNNTQLMSAMKRSKSQDATSAQTSSNTPTLSLASAVKRSKSRERVAFTPPSVTNLESLKSAQNKARQAASGSLSEGELPRTVPGLTAKQAPTTPKQARKTNGVSAPQPEPEQETPRKQPETVVYPVASQSTPARPPQATLTSTTATTSGWRTPQATKYDTPSGAPAWGSDTETSKNKFANGTNASSKTILQRPNGTPAGTAPRNSSKSVSQAQMESTSASNVQKYIEALTAARSDPVAYLESHTLFNSETNRKAKKLSYVDSTSTPKKCIVQVKVDGKMVASSAAAGQDVKLAKARAAFKAIDALSVRSKRIAARHHANFVSVSSYLKRLQSLAMLTALRSQSRETSSSHRNHRKFHLRQLSIRKRHQPSRLFWPFQATLSGYQISSRSLTRHRSMAHLHPLQHHLERRKASRPLQRPHPHQILSSSRNKLN